MFYAIDGKVLSAEEWAHALNGRTQGREIFQRHLPNGWMVSTVWLGLDHSFAGGPPTIFESMVFSAVGSKKGDYECERYATLAEALHGHEILCARWRKKKAAWLRRDK
jgi:hypothetical protein